MLKITESTEKFCSDCESCYSSDQFDYCRKKEQDPNFKGFPFPYAIEVCESHKLKSKKE